MNDFISNLPISCNAFSNITFAFSIKRAISNNLTDPTKIRAISGDGAYDTRRCYEAIAKKKASPLIPPRIGAAYWEHGHPVIEVSPTSVFTVVTSIGKKMIGYHKHSLSETAMFRCKTLINSSLTLRDYNAQVGEVYAAIRAMNKLTRLGMPVSLTFKLNAEIYLIFDLGNKAMLIIKLNLMFQHLC